MAKNETGEEFFHAELFTENFHFSTFGKTRARAHALMVDALAIHAKQYHRDARALVRSYKHGIEITRYTMGCMYRDRETLLPAKS